MIKGSLVPNITLFKADGQLDLDKTGWHMRWMLDRGVDGLFLTGSYGSGPLMTLEERVAVFELAKSIAASYPGRSLIAHVGCIDTVSTVKLAKEAERVGMDAVSAVPPFYYKHAEDLIIQFYKEIVEATSLPVFAYNNPETSRFGFTMGTVRKLQSIGLAGLKDSPVDVGFLSQVFYEVKQSKKDFQVIPGTSKGWLPYYYMGMRTMIAGMNNWAPEIITALVKATESGNVEQSERLYLLMMDLSAKLHFTDSTIASIMALYARGYDGGFPRKPMLILPFDNPKYKEIRAWLQEGFDRIRLPMDTGPLTV